MKTELDRGTGVPVYQQIADSIRAVVEGGGLAPLSRVPSETDLAAQFGVSRMTARKSLDLLVDEARLFRRQGKGTYVVGGRIDHPGTSQFSFSAAISGLGLRLTTKVQVAALQPATPRVARGLRIPPEEPVICIRRLRLIEDEPSAIHSTYLLRRFAAVLAYDLTGSLTDAMVGAGVEVANVRDTLQSVLPSASEAQMLQLPVGVALMRVEGIGEDHSRVPLRFTDSLYRGDRFRFMNDSGRTAGMRLEMK